MDRQVIEHPARAEFPEAIESGKIGADQRDEASRAVRHEQFRFPGGHAAVAIQPGPHIEKRRWTLGVPAMLAGAHPLHAHRFADCARKQRCIAGGILMPIAAVTACAFHVNAADV
jgi:hypothetical protein